MGSYTPCSFILMILVFLFGAIAIFSLIASFIFSIIYAVNFKKIIPISCNFTNFSLSISLTLLITLFFIFLFISVVITKKYEKLKLTILFLMLTLLSFTAIFILLILIPYYSSNNQINQKLPSIVHKFIKNDSKCLNDFKEEHDCKTLANCTISVETIIKKKYNPIRKSSIILVSITDGSIVLGILFLIFFFAPCPCGPVHNLNRF